MYKIFTSKRCGISAHLSNAALTVKLSLVFFLIATFQAKAVSVLRQEVSIQLKNASIKEVFNNLTKQTGYDFLYVSEELNGTVAVNLEFEHQPLGRVLDHVFSKQPVTYEIENKTVFIKERIVGEQQPIP